MTRQLRDLPASFVPVLSRVATRVHPGAQDCEMKDRAPELDVVVLAARGRRDGWRRRGILAAAAIAAISGLSACGASPSSPGGSSSAGGSANSHQLAFSACMRSHGVTEYPDPNSTGTTPKESPQQLRVSSLVLRTAQSACQHLLAKGNQSAQASDQQVMNALWKFARCLRSHRVPNWPDPLAESDPGEPNTPGFPRTLHGITTTSPRVKSAMNKCQPLLAGIGYPSGGYP